MVIRFPGGGVDLYERDERYGDQLEDEMRPPALGPFAAAGISTWLCKPISVTSHRLNKVDPRLDYLSFVLVYKYGRDG